MIVEMNLYASFYVVLYKYFKYLGLAMISFNFLKYASLSHNPRIVFCIVMLKYLAYVLIKKSDARDAYTSDRYECIYFDWHS